MRKDAQRGCNIHMDVTCSIIPHLHLTPQGIGPKTPSKGPPSSIAHFDPHRVFHKWLDKQRQRAISFPTVFEFAEFLWNLEFRIPTKRYTWRRRHLWFLSTWQVQPTTSRNAQFRPSELTIHAHEPNLGTALVSTTPSSMAQARKQRSPVLVPPNIVQKKLTFQRSHYRRVQLKRVSNIRPSQSRQETGSLRRRRGIGRLRPFQHYIDDNLCRYTEICALNGQRKYIGFCMTYWATIPNKALDAISRDKLFTHTIDARFPGISL
jgi:hypothetical protein